MEDKFFASLDIDTLSRLADIVCEKELAEITVADGDKVVTVKGKKQVMASPAFSMPAAPVQPVNVPSPALILEKPAEPAVSGNVVKSPIVGTYYGAPSPEKPPFVRVGDTVKKGDVIMIIESMKLMNEVQSDYSGTVKEILVQNGEAVEYDQPIMIIE